MVVACLRRTVAAGSLRVRGANRADRADVAVVVVVVVPRMLSKQRAVRLVAGLARGVAQARSGGCSAIAGCIKESNSTHIAADAFMLPFNQKVEAQAAIRALFTFLVCGTMTSLSLLWQNRREV